MASKHGTVAHLLPPRYRSDVTAWLAEDCPSFDYGGFVVGDTAREARLLCKSAGILAGVPFFDEVFRQLECRVEWHVAEGSMMNMQDVSPSPSAPPPTSPSTSPPASQSPSQITHAATVYGSVRNILLGERVALNTLARCSGIATRTYHTRGIIKQAIADAQQQQQQQDDHRFTTPILAGTRKTTPGFRLVEKYGMLIGGADPHRHDLSSMTMLKDNHVWACGGSIGTAVAAAKAAGGFAVKVEVECTSEEEARTAIESGADVVMLDNFTPADAERAVRNLRQQYADRTFLLEISGGLTEQNLPAYARAGVDVLSTSSIHQGVPHVDFSLKIVH